jgi:hypothetical protein
MEIMSSGLGIFSTHLKNLINVVVSEDVEIHRMFNNNFETRQTRRRRICPLGLVEPEQTDGHLFG